MMQKLRSFQLHKETGKNDKNGLEINVGIRMS